MLRCVRYAGTVVFALLAVGFVALWVRSYTFRDTIYNARGHALSYKGVVTCALYEESWPPGDPSHFWLSRPITVNDHFSPWDSGSMGFNLIRQQVGNGIAIPYWFLAASSLGLAALLTFKRTWRFSLRSVLVATTILAALLGLAVYLV